MRIFPKRRTKLDRAWHNCERLWSWIGKMWLKENCEVSSLKTIWFRRHPLKIRTGGSSMCFFCTYAEKIWTANIGNRPPRPEEWSRCDYCPGKLVDPSFHCTNTQYHYRFHPSLFYKEIKRLNLLRKRLETVARSKI